MIIFDLDCLADDSHRRHFIDPTCSECKCALTKEIEFDSGWHCYYPCDNVTQKSDWKSDYKAYNEACGGDKSIESCADIIRQLSLRFPEDWKPIHVWSNTPELYKEKIQDWVWYNIGSFKYDLKMRPNDNTEPEENLFESWVDHFAASGKQIEYVFSAHKPTIEMFRRRGIFVFDCNQERE